MAEQFNHGQEINKMVQAMSPEQRKAFEKVVMAGKKILYSPETKGIIDEFMASDADLGEKLGAGIANLVVMIDNKTNGALPKDVIIPAATVLLFDAADALTQMGETVTTEEIGQAYEIMFYNIFEAYGAKPEQVDAEFDRIGQAAQASAPPKPGGMIHQGKGV